MKFFVHEVRDLKEAFPDTKGTFDSDFEEFELEAINNFGALKNHAHFYLGRTLHIFKTLC